MEIYTETDAAYDIIWWQIPAAFLLALLLVVYMIYSRSFEIKMETTWGYLFVIVTCVLNLYLHVCAAFFCLDMLVLPPLFALVKMNRSL